jgi:predicted lipoprotein with Yx(FWY)xxD motif
MANFKSIAGVLGVLMIVFAAVAGYLLVFPTTVTKTTTEFSTATQTGAPIAPQTSTTTSTTTVTVSASASSTASAPTVSLAYKPLVGYYLTNGSGWTLYLYTRDLPNNGTSACYGACAKTWPAFYSANINVPLGVNASNFGTITRTDGTKQSTYNGWPLYYFAPDKAAGETNGQGIAGVWYAISPEAKATTQIAGSPDFTVGVAYKAPIGAYMTNGSGWTLYLYTKDVPNNGTSACYGACAQVWPAFFISNLVVPPGFNASAFATITRTDGSKQLTYMGYPLYTYAPDKASGETNGQGVGGVWFAFTLPKATP